VVQRDDATEPCAGRRAVQHGVLEEEAVPRAEVHLRRARVLGWPERKIQVGPCIPVGIQR
jgi:hypothetical protein